MSNKHDEWLQQVLELHLRLAPAAKSLLSNVLRERGVDFLSVTARVKDHKSALDKISRKKYDSPDIQLTDLTGVRVVLYFESDSKKCIDIIRSLFEIDNNNSLDQSNLLGFDKIGYRSTHFVCSLGEKRSILPEYEKISGLKFEIQVRTVLQHAWAELAHDRSYKFGPGLPPDIQREINLYSGLLEIADQAFDRIATSIQTYQTQLGSQTEAEFYKEPINTLTLRQYEKILSEEFSFEIEGDDKKYPNLLYEIDRMGLSYISDLNNLKTREFIQAYQKSGLKDPFIGIVRDMLMFHDMNRYFSQKLSWDGIDRKTLEFLKFKYPEAAIRDAIASAQMTFDIEEGKDKL